MASINAKLLALGVIIFFVGVGMPAETTETTWDGGYKYEETEENPYKYPIIVVGGVLSLASFVIDDDSDSTEQTTQPPDD